MLKSRASALFSLLLVFLSGVLVGLVAYRLYVVNTVVGTSTAVRPPRPDPEELRKRIVEDMRSHLKLDEQQVGQLNSIYDETRREFDQLHKEFNGRGRLLWDKQTDQIRAILTPQQRPLYEQLRVQREAEREADRKRRHEQDQKK